MNPDLKIVSGGQTGVDVALALGLPCGGWCPRGRRTEAGPLPDHYPVQETAERNYQVRTRCNIEDSDGHDMVQPSGEGAMRCMRQALEGVTEPVDYINTHSTNGLRIKFDHGRAVRVGGAILLIRRSSSDRHGGDEAVAG